ncbi:MAG: hypothetical protein IPH04_19110 [Saprospirales bacterium]|nr:hypothetical protein [Saprospirales bacterium]
MFDVTRNPFKAAIALVAASLIFIGEIQAQSQTFTSSGTYTVPAGVTAIVVQVWGAGGGGGSGNAGNNSRGGGGGGAFAASMFPVTPGNTYAVVVGAGGAPGLDGGSSSFGGFLVVADGGEGGDG